MSVGPYECGCVLGIARLVHVAGVRCSFARALEFYDISEASVRTGWAVLSLFQPRSVS